MEKIAVRTFGIGRITTIEKQATKLMQEIGGSTKLQFTVKAYFLRMAEHNSKKYVLIVQSYNHGI